MKQITKITAQKRSGRFNVFVNDEYAFAVSTNVLGDFMLAKGKELTDELIDEIKQAEQNAKAQEKALGYLSYQPRSIKEIRQYMQKQEVDEETTEIVIKRLVDLGYLDDDNFAKLFINNARIINFASGMISVLGAKNFQCSWNLLKTQRNLLKSMDKITQK